MDVGPRRRARLGRIDRMLARDGEAASKRARETSFDLILLDVMLPKKDGFEVCRELRRTGVGSMILLLTARTEETEKVLGRDRRSSQSSPAYELAVWR